MKKCLFIATLFFIIYSQLFSVIRADFDDSAAILELANAIRPLPEGWSTVNGTGYCNWINVGCDSAKRVTEINLANKNLSGTLPSSLSTLSHLQNLTLERNNLSGHLPNFSNLSFLQELVIGSNQFYKIPAGFFRGLTSLQVFNISTNMKLAGWSLPHELSQSTKLEKLDASYANLKGSIPDIFSSLSNLQVLNLSGVGLTGSLPASFANSNIQYLWLDNHNDQGLSGTVDVLALMTKLELVSVNQNLLTGPIPDFSNCEKLLYLDLGYNKLTGLVPISLLTHPTLREVSLDVNMLQGPQPENPGYMALNVDDNNFCDKEYPLRRHSCDSKVTKLLNIASALRYPLVLSDGWSGNNACNFKFITCDLLNNIGTVNFGNLNLSGSISSEFSNLTALRILLLNDNNLTDPIPDILTKLPNLQVLDVSNNNLSGTVPNFASTVKVIIEGNPLLRTINDPERVDQQPTSRTGKRAYYFVIISVFSLIFVVILTFVVLRIFFKKRILNSAKARSQDTELGYCDNYVLSKKQFSSHVDGRNGVISIEFLQRITDNFSEKNLSGRGGYGVVYRGVLDDGTFVAVKRMEAAKDLEGFQSEIKVLTEVRHKHLVAFLCYFINSKEKILVYEYMPQGTLQHHLFEWRNHGFHPLTWKQRVTIALDVARGVEYLHSLAQESFIHRDLKPSNILLGDDMRAKVADFGLVKKASNGRYSTETKVAGTFGYLAPEYAATGKVTGKIDVYAFGVILMEMITGTKAVDETVQDEGWMRMHLVTWFSNVLTENEDISRAIDEAINLDDKTLRNITEVAKLAAHCTCPEPDRRPDMSHVVNTLVFLLEDWKPPF